MQHIPEAQLVRVLAIGRADRGKMQTFSAQVKHIICK